MHAAPNGAVLGREELKWQNNGAIVSHNTGVCAQDVLTCGLSGYTGSSPNIGFQEIYELGCSFFLLFPQYCCHRKITKMLGKI